MLYQLSYDHHAHRANPVLRDNHSHTTGGAVERVRGYSPAAIAFAASTSGPGCGTKTVRR